MENFNLLDYSKIGNNKILKVKLKEDKEVFFAKSIFDNLLQPYQPKLSIITKVNILKIIDIEIYKNDDNLKDNEIQLQVEPYEIESIEIIEI